MGYDSYGGGELVAVPALPDNFLKPWTSENREMVLEAVSVIDERVEVLPNGEIGVVGDSKTTFLMPNEEFRGDLMAEVTAIAAACKKRKCLLNGRLQIQGEDHGDIWRIKVVDNAVDEQHPDLVWPDGEKGW